MYSSWAHPEENTIYQIRYLKESTNNLYKIFHPI